MEATKQNGLIRNIKTKYLQPLDFLDKPCQNQLEQGIWLLARWVAQILEVSSDATHGSLALKAYQQNLYLEYYY